MTTALSLPSFGQDITANRVNEVAARYAVLSAGHRPASFNMGDPRVMENVNEFLKWVSEQDWSSPVAIDGKTMDRVCGQGHTARGIALRACLRRVGGGAPHGPRTYEKDLDGLRSLIAAINLRLKVEMRKRPAKSS